MVLIGVLNYLEWRFDCNSTKTRKIFIWCWRNGYFQWNKIVWIDWSIFLIQVRCFHEKNLEVETLARIAFTKKFEFFREIATMKWRKILYISQILQMPNSYFHFHEKNSNFYPISECRKKLLMWKYQDWTFKLFRNGVRHLTKRWPPLRMKMTNVKLILNTKYPFRTVWKFSNFSATQILRENNFRGFRQSKITNIFTFHIIWNGAK